MSAATTVLGAPVANPFLVAPTAIHGLAHPEAEVATARGAAAAGSCLVLSSLATRSLEDVAAAAPGAPRWMQVYVLRDRGRTAEMVARTAAAGYSALVLTVDAPVSGLRLREVRGGVHLPEDLALPNLAASSTERAREGGFMAVVTGEFDPALTFDDVGWLAGLAGLPVVVKGVLAGRRRRPVRGGRGGGGRRLQPRRPPARRRAGHRRRAGRGGRRPSAGVPRSTSTAASAGPPTPPRRSPWEPAAC